MSAESSELCREGPGRDAQAGQARRQLSGSRAGVPAGRKAEAPEAPSPDFEVHELGSFVINKVFFHPQLLYGRSEDHVQKVVNLSNFDEDVLPVSLVALSEEDEYHSRSTDSGWLSLARWSKSTTVFRICIAQAGGRGVRMLDASSCWHG